MIIIIYNKLKNLIMPNKKATFVYDNLGWIILALVLALILIMAFPSIAEGFDNAIEKLRNLI